MDKDLIKFNDDYHKKDKWKPLSYKYYKSRFLRELYNRLQRRKYYLFSFLPQDASLRDRILDWGCGKSGLPFALKKELKYREVHGCDVSATAIKENKNYALDNNYDVEFRLISDDSLPYENDYFDAIITTDVFGHVDKPILRLKELHRILKPSGVIAFHTESKYRPNYFYRKIIKKLGFDPWADYIGHINLNTKKELIDMFHQAGFKIEKVISPKAYFSVIFAIDILWGLNLLKNEDLSIDLWLLKEWHTFLNKNNIISKGFKAISCLFLFIEEQVETKLFKENYFANYFKLRK
ncbi:class I SAM-dependent methyltransferase [Candidatus Woesearchaeota archaeon]|nr:class I SAM-dependent methyltransferase [Candidatus Woesearchaeota archaeon]